MNGRSSARGTRFAAATLAALTVALAMPACSREGTGDNPGADHVRAVVMPYLTFMPFHIALEEGYFAEQNLDVEFVRLERMQDLMTGLARSEVDVAAGMLTANVMSSIASGVKMRLVGALGHLPPEGCSFSAIAARTEHFESGALEDRERLRNMVFDTDVLLPYGYWLEEVLRPFDLTIDDVEHINLPESAAVAAVQGGSVDVTLVSEPFLSLLTGSGEARIWWQTNAIVPDYQISVMMYGPTILDDRPEVGERFATAMLKAIRRYMEGKTPENLDVVERITGLSSEQVASACWPAARADARIDLVNFHDYQEWSLSKGYINRILTEDELVDHRFIEYANRELER
jgi:NitT/TauT family transport system substrate-binding protein